MDGGTGMRSKEVDDWAMYSQIAREYNAFLRRFVWLTETKAR